MQRNSFQPPVNVGEELDVRIEAVGEKGDGVARVKGFVLFVPGTKEGEQCHIRVTKVLSKLGFAEKIGAAKAKSADAAESQENASEEAGSEEMTKESESEDTESKDEEFSEDF